MDDILTEAFIRQCPMFALVFRNLIRDGKVDQLYKDNHYYIDEKYANDYELDFDVTIIEMLLTELYSKTLKNYLNPFYAYYGAPSYTSDEFLVFYLDTDIQSELHILERQFNLSTIKLADSYVYYKSNSFVSKVIARKFSFRKDEIEPFIEKLNYDKLNKFVKKMVLEKKLT